MALAPKMVTVLGADKLGRDAQAIALPTDAPFEQRRRPESLADFPHVLLLATEGERGRARSRAQPGNACEWGDDFVGRPVAEVLVIPIPAQVD